MILGLRTAIVPTPDLAAGKAWYTRAFETEPYFDEPFYVGFAIGGFELGLVPDGATPGDAGAYPMWGVADLAMELARLIALGESAPPAAPGQSQAATVLRGLLDAAGYRAFLDKEYADDPAEAETRWACVEEVAAALDEHERARPGQSSLAAVIRGFLDDFVLQVEEQEDRFQDDKPKNNVLRLMTLHAAKGLEFDCVWMVGMEEGILPHHRSLGDGLQAVDEERRLCYVGVTRAKRRLMLSMCLTRTKWGKSKPCRPSRFLYELTGQADKFSETPPDKPDKPEPPPRGRKRRR